jgi:hypothetical protein
MATKKMEMGKPLPNPKPSEPKKPQSSDQRRPKGDTGTTDIFREGMTPPVDDDMGSMSKFSKGAKPFRKGGYVTKADGCAKRGKTKGKIL